MRATCMASLTPHDHRNTPVLTQMPKRRTNLASSAYLSVLTTLFKNVTTIAINKLDVHYRNMPFSRSQPLKVLSNSTWWEYSPFVITAFKGLVRHTSHQCEGDYKLVYIMSGRRMQATINQVYFDIQVEVVNPNRPT